MIKTKWVHRNGIAHVKMHFIQMWPHTFFNKFQIEDFPECFHRQLKTL